MQTSRFIKKSRLLTLFAVLAGFFGLVNLVLVDRAYANTEAAKEACGALSALDVECNPAGTAEEIAGGPVRALINILTIVVGIVSVVMIIVGGFKFITSGGNSDGTKSARNTIIYALVGLVVVLLAQVMVRYVFGKATSVGAPTPGEAARDIDVAW